MTVLIFIVFVTSVFAQNFFRTELFPEQLEQQQIQFKQIEIQQQVQDLQRQFQVSGPEGQAGLLIQQEELTRQLKELQDRQLVLQERIQQQLSGGQAIFDRPRDDFDNQRIVNNFANTPVARPPGPPPNRQRPQAPPPKPQPPLFRPDPTFQQPRPAEGGSIPCTTETGETGFCQPLIKCLSFYAELPELKRQPCQLGANELGVCCPRRAQIAPSPNQQNSGVLRPPPPPNVVIPSISPQQLNQVAQIALQKLQERFNFVAQLFANKVFVTPGTPAFWHLEFFPTTNETLQQGEEAQKTVEASVDLVSEFNLSPDQGTFALPAFNVLNTVLRDTCPQSTVCRPSKYRSADGSCNNLKHDRWGQAGTALQRILPPKYGDGVNSPRTTAANGQPLPSARLVSTNFAQEADAPSSNYTLMVMQYGQFLDHDLTHTPISRGQSGSGISCCRDGLVIPDNLRHPDCFQIELPRTDRVFSPFAERCMEFVRSLPAPRPECNFGPREQMNQITGHLDGSNIYGSNPNSQRNLREFRGGRLRIQTLRGKEMLPANPGECTSEDNTTACFQAGDGRVNEHVNLALTHTVWMREHNRVVNALARLHPDWNDELLFQEGRRIVVAEMQHITYNEFLPIILGREYMNKFQLTPRENGFTQLYDNELNAGITNVFATAAFRFGHSLIQGHMHGYGRFGNVRENLQLSKQHFAPFILYSEGVVDDMIRGLSSQSCQEFDRFFTKEITDRLFQGDLDLGLDLFALNVQRGRDHGLPPYNDWREVCGLPRARDWQSLNNFMDPDSVSRLSKLYGSVDEVDLFAGAVAEKHAPGAMLGPTFVCLIGDQFARFRRGDRFFYEESGQPSSFSERQLDQIRKASLARILCDNADNIALIQPLAFVQPSFLNQRVSCSSKSIPTVELNAWAQETPPRG